MALFTKLRLLASRFYHWVTSKLTSLRLLAITACVASAYFLTLFLAKTGYLWTLIGSRGLFYWTSVLFFAAAIAAILAFTFQGHEMASKTFTSANLILALLAGTIQKLPPVPPRDVSSVTTQLTNTDHRIIELDDRARRIATGMLMSSDNMQVALGELALQRFPESLKTFDQLQSDLTTRLADVRFFKARVYWAMSASGTNTDYSQKALKEAEASLKLRPLYSKALNIQCGALRDAGLLDDAKQACEESVRADPYDEGAWNGLGATFILIGDQSTDGRGSYDEALSAISQGIAVHPTPELWANKALVLQYLCRDEEGLDAAEHALAFPGIFANALLTKGTLLGRLRRYDDAKLAFNELVRLNSSDAEAWNDLGHISEETGDRVNAMTYYNQALHLSASMGPALFNKGELLNEEARYTEAIESLKLAAISKPRDAETYYELAFALYGASMTTETAEDRVDAEQRRENARHMAMESLSLQPHYTAARNLLNAIRKRTAAVIDTAPSPSPSGLCSN